MFKRAFKWGVGKAKGKNKANEGDREKRGDDVNVKIYKKPKNSKEEKNELCMGEGSWMSHLTFEGETYWRVEDNLPEWMERKDNKMSDGSLVLPSDTEKREDIPHMMRKDWEEAEKSKVAMEELQRHDKRLRTAGSK
jgi:hypothetical protein